MLCSYKNERQIQKYFKTTKIFPKCYFQAKKLRMQSLDLDFAPHDRMEMTVRIENGGYFYFSNGIISHNVSIALSKTTKRTYVSVGGFCFFLCCWFISTYFLLLPHLFHSIPYSRLKNRASEANRKILWRRKKWMKMESASFWILRLWPIKAPAGRRNMNMGRALDRRAAQLKFF